MGSQDSTSGGVAGGRRTVVWPALDGMRGLAVTAVILFHLDPTRAPELDPLRPSGGFLGVDIFFVISGFLITSLLLGERETTGRIGFKDFYARRALRLFPALVAAILLALAIVTAVHGDPLQRVWLRPTLVGLPWVVLYLGNWHIVAANGAITNGALLHTWSLAVEEQFYLLFPVVLWAALSRRVRRSHLVGVLGGLAAVVMAWRFYVGHTGAGLDRVYYATDTHSDGLLAGAALAIAMTLPAVKRWMAGPAGQRAVRVGAALGASVLVVLLVRADQNSEPGMELTIAAAVAATVLVVAGVVVGLPSGLRWTLEHPVLQWIGKRSYGLYLYGFMLNIPVAAWAGGLGSRRADAVAVAVTFLAAAASYRWLERPFLARKSRYQRHEAILAPPPAAPRPSGTLPLSDPAPLVD